MYSGIIYPAFIILMTVYTRSGPVSGKFHASSTAWSNTLLWKVLSILCAIKTSIMQTDINPLPITNDAYIMRHGSSHFFHKAMGIYMGGLTLDANTL